MLAWELSKVKDRDFVEHANLPLYELPVCHNLHAHCCHLVDYKPAESKGGQATYPTVQEVCSGV